VSDDDALVGGPPTHPWHSRVGPLLRVLCVLFSMFLFALALASLYSWIFVPACTTQACRVANGGGPPNALEAIAFAIPFIGLATWAASWGWVSVSSDGVRLRVVKTFWRGYEIELATITAVVSGRFGPTLLLADGTTRHSWIPQGDVNYGFGQRVKQRAQRFIDDVMADADSARK
jgi:hypothetical protein